MSMSEKLAALAAKVSGSHRAPQSRITAQCPCALHHAQRKAEKEASEDGGAKAAPAPTESSEKKRKPEAAADAAAAAPKSSEHPSKKCVDWSSWIPDALWS